MLDTDFSTLHLTARELKRRAHRERSLAVNALMRSAIRAFATWLSALGGRLMHRLDNAWRYRRTVRALQRLNDRALADIGLSRGEIEFRAIALRR
jgi:uncharacterized protein YjiS (DUF1127 family)